jgi:hypothetical protein
MRVVRRRFPTDPFRNPADALAEVSERTRIPTARLVHNGVDRELAAHGVKLQNGARVKGGTR